MRSLPIALAALFALALALPSLAGEGCPHAAKASAATAEAPVAPAGHAHKGAACPASCPYAAAVSVDGGSAGCACAGKTAVQDEPASAQNASPSERDTAETLVTSN